MSFVAYDLSFLLIFCLALGLFLYIRRNNLKREGLLILYRTKLGIKIIDFLGTRNKRFLNILGYIVIFAGFILMIVSIYSILQFVWIFVKTPELFKLVKIPPIAPLVPYLPQLFKADYLPPFYFTYWIVVLAVTAIVHEFFHGIFARASNVKIKSTGFAFLGPFTGAFVEPDEKKLQKKPVREQLAMLSAGSFSNLILAILFFIVLWGFFSLAYAPSGVIFSDYTKAVVNVSSINNITNENIFVKLDGGFNLTKIYANNAAYYINTASLSKLQNYSYVILYEDAPAMKAGLIGAIIEFNGQKITDDKQFTKALAGASPGQNVTIKTAYQNIIKEYSIILGERPGNSSRAYLGIATIDIASLNAKSSFFGKLRNKLVFFKDPNTYYKPKHAEELTIFGYNLIWWMILVNLGVALFNMLPIGITDGGRVFYLTVAKITGSEKFAKISYKFSTYLFLALFLLLTVIWIFNFR